MAQTTDAALDEEGQTGTRDRANPTAQFLSQDGKIDELDAIEVKDAWARGKFMKQLMMADGWDALPLDERQKLENWLLNKTNAGLIEVAIHALGRTHSLVDSLGWEGGPGNVETLFDWFTGDDKSDEELVELAREDLKTSCACSGMRDIRVMRERVQAHTEG